MELNLNQLIHFQGSTVLDTALTRIDSRKSLDELLAKRFATALDWLPEEDAEILQTGITECLNHWWGVIEKDSQLQHLLFGSEQLQTYASGYQGQDYQKFLVTLHTMGSILDAFRGDDDAEIMEREFGWQEILSQVTRAEVTEKTKRDFARYPRDLDRWKVAVRELGQVIANIDSELHTKDPIECESNVTYTDVIEQLVVFDKQQLVMSEARTFLLMLSRLALLTGVFIRVSRRVYSISFECSYRCWKGDPSKTFTQRLQCVQSGFMYGAHTFIPNL
jgi:hypothetical protein